MTNNSRRPTHFSTRYSNETNYILALVISHYFDQWKSCPSTVLRFEQAQVAVGRDSMQPTRWCRCCYCCCFRELSYSYKGACCERGLASIEPPQTIAPRPVPRTNPWFPVLPSHWIQKSFFSSFASIRDFSVRESS